MTHEVGVLFFGATVELSRRPKWASTHLKGLHKLYDAEAVETSVFFGFSAFFLTSSTKKPSHTANTSMKKEKSPASPLKAMTR